jgi:hypothetical protein
MLTWVKCIWMWYLCIVFLCMHWMFGPSSYYTEEILVNSWFFVSAVLHIYYLIIATVYTLPFFLRMPTKNSRKGKSLQFEDPQTNQNFQESSYPKMAKSTSFQRTHHMLHFWRSDTKWNSHNLPKDQSTTSDHIIDNGICIRWWVCFVSHSCNRVLDSRLSLKCFLGGRVPYIL